MNIIQSLVNDSEKQAYQMSWKDFFYDPTKVRSVKSAVDPPNGCRDPEGGAGLGWRRLEYGFGITQTVRAHWRAFSVGRFFLVQKQLSVCPLPFLGGGCAQDGSQ